ncbi:MAG TPA: hypothetical protein VFL57_17615 [Bryobacteraceae bacterium]|nr:hypothetical protein [Bryobacteraceae bacterium]
MAARDLSRFIGRSPDNLSWKEQLELDGVWVAFEMYSPLRLPLRRFEAIGESAAECRRQLEARGADPTEYEYLPLARS